jgi:signal peptidase I
MRLREWAETEGRELLEIMLTSVVLALLLTTFVAQPFMVEGSSMEPNLHSGERVIVSKMDYRFRQPRLGDVIVFKYPADPRVRYIKRVIGVGGDVISIHGGQVLVNGRRLTEPYLTQETWGDMGPVTVPSGRLFLLGDNRGNSKDSRFPDVGLVPARLIVGRASLVYWPVWAIGAIAGPAVVR